VAIQVQVTNLYNEAGDLVIAQAQGEGFTINWKINDGFGASMGDILYAQINRLAAIAQREPLDDNMQAVMDGLMAANAAWRAANPAPAESTA
jgi:hypothetical protein